jgi:O-antigen/teichoic acid export membrane protein
MPPVKSVFHGAILTVSMRWTDRLIGLVSMVILARLLTPADFGVVAMCTVVVALVDVLLDLGVSVALIQHHAADKDDYDSAWTIRLIQSGIAGLLIFLGAPLAADYYHNPQVIDVLRVMAFSVCVAGLENIGIVSFQKHLEFGNDFRFFFYKRVIGFAVTLAAAIVLRSYWAMIIGTFAGRAIGVALSYAMHPHRPKFTLSRLSRIWSFSQWVLARNIGTYLGSRVDRLLVGARAGAGITGAYAVADEIAAMPTTELLAPLGRVLFPVFVQKRDDPAAFSGAVSTAIGVQATVAVPACIGLVVVANDAVPLLLGPQWSQAIPLLRILAIIHLLVAMTHAGGYALLSMGKIKALALVSWLRALLFLSIAVMVFPGADAERLAEIRLFASAVSVIALVCSLLMQSESFRPRALFLPLVRPILAAGIMAIGLALTHLVIADLPLALRLPLQIVFGCMIYTASIALLWLAAGRPDGPEAYLLKNIGNTWTKFIPVQR